mmetsp:Transcript_53321/g.116279  ORF Transcript_53321/g.116279 Transcript_53321/m.116279 type:complete len:312 (-) Transcript_53321:282-1217(-)
MRMRHVWCARGRAAQAAVLAPKMLVTADEKLETALLTALETLTSAPLGAGPFTAGACASPRSGATLFVSCSSRSHSTTLVAWVSVVSGVCPATMSCACLIRMSAFGPAVPCSRAISPETASGAGSGCGGSGSGSGTCSRSPSRSTRKPSCLSSCSWPADPAIAVAGNMRPERCWMSSAMMTRRSRRFAARRNSIACSTRTATEGFAKIATRVDCNCRMVRRICSSSSAETESLLSLMRHRCSSSPSEVLTTSRGSSSPSSQAICQARTISHRRGWCARRRQLKQNLWPQRHCTSMAGTALSPSGALHLAVA